MISMNLSTWIHTVSMGLGLWVGIVLLVIALDSVFTLVSGYLPTPRRWRARFDETAFRTMFHTGALRFGFRVRFPFRWPRLSRR